MHEKIVLETCSDKELLIELSKRIKERKIKFAFDGTEQTHSELGCCSYDFLWWRGLYSDDYELDFKKIEPIKGDYDNAE
ncbi:protein of unknown function [endosymbiont DhMRE of Dentiscutata heterogama]|uniref:hypothetical protein n=1 Tax=endosymbiont DhMRE of Dentiscutata heterogama TaxID=1609546 RepID=UPI000629D842|nr:hypothetical protein [endosymbiont DhMRE of Dentiscutata heterogama]CFW92949.1 protein of unknown function [endosymbiont DhMRE of Dentiscutata heterogama]